MSFFFSFFFMRYELGVFFFLSFLSSSFHFYLFLVLGVENRKEYGTGQQRWGCYHGVTRGQKNQSNNLYYSLYTVWKTVTRFLASP